MLTSLCGTFWVMPFGLSVWAEESYFADEDQVIEEIIVVARKRLERLQAIPATINVLSAREIEERGLTGLKDIAAMTANFSYDEAFGRNNLQRPVIRGMSNILGAANAAFFVDGIYIPGGMASTSLFDLQRVEILKGPGTALYGRATLSGAVNYVTRRPGNELEGRISTSVASYSEYEVTARLAGPLIKDKLGLSLAARHYEYGGQYENTGPGGGKVGQEKSQSLSGSLNLKASDNFGAYLRLSYQKDDDGHSANTLQPASANNCFAETSGYFCGEVQSPEAVALNLDVFDDPGLKRDIFRASLILDWTFDGVRLSSLSSYNSDRLKDQRDNDFLPVAALGGAFHVLSDTKIQSYSQELRINSNRQGPYRWLVGGYYYHERTDDSLSAPFSRRPYVTISPVGRVHNNALFGSFEYDVTEQFSATIEGRMNWDKISIEPDSGLREKTFTTFTPRFAINYQASEAANLYLTIARGTKPGGFNGDLYGSSVPQSERDRLVNYLTYAEEQAWNYEIGAKSKWLDGRLIVNLAAFYIDWTEQQLTTSFPVTGFRRARPLINNAGKTEVKGFEVEMQLRANDYWSFSASYGYADGEFKLFEDETQERLTGDASVAGNKTPRAPRHTLNFNSSFDYPISDELEFFLRGDLNYRSSRFVQVHNLAIIGATTKVNMQTGINWQDIRLTFFVRNLFNDDTPADVTRFFDASTFRMERAFLITLPRTREWGLRVEYNF